MHDLRYALRFIWKRPTVTIVIACTMALGIGATTTIFSVVDAILLRPLPYVEADRLATIWENVKLPEYTNPQNPSAPGNYSAWRADNSTFVDMAALRSSAWNLTGSGDPVRVEGAMVSGSLFQLLKVQAAHGRTFTPEEDRVSPSRVVLLGHGLWTDRFGADLSVINKTILLNDEAYTVVGIMPPGFHFPDPGDQLWVPLALTPAQLADHDSHFLRVVGLLKPGVTIEQARADLSKIADGLATTYPNTNTGVGVALLSLRDQIAGDVRRPLLVVLVIVGFLLLMVCTNISTLLLAQASARDREFAIRTAFGARRANLVRQLMAEGVLLAIIGGILGLAVAASGVVFLRWLQPSELPRIDDIVINGHIAAFNALVTFAAGLICGIAPALQSRVNVNEALKQETRASASRAALGTRNVLVVLQVALGVVVLVGAASMLRSFVNLTRVPVGFRSDGVLTFRVNPPAARYSTEEQRTAFYRQLGERLQALPGVSSAAVISFLPLSGGGRTAGISIEGEPPLGPGQMRMVDFRSASPGYFGAMAIPVRTGRDVSWNDTPATQPVVVVSETAARAFWPKQDPIGKRLKLGAVGDEGPWLTVVGIVGDVRQVDLVNAPRPAIYLSAAQGHAHDTLRDWVVRTSGDPLALGQAVRRTVWSVDANLPVTRVQTLAQLRAAITASQRFILLLVGLFAVLAVVLAVMGLYGITAYTVTQRTREFGIRLALGASRSALLRLALVHSARLALAGLAVGILAALALAQLMSSVLFDIGPRDPMTFAGVALLLVFVSLAASYAPARRATRVDPMVAMRV